MSAKTMELSTMTLHELQARLKMFGVRGQQLCGRLPDGRPLGPAVKEFFDNLLSSTTDPEKIKQRNEFLARAEKDPVAKQQLCGIRVETLNNYILASINIAAMFFDVVNLADDERPVVQNTTEQQINVAYVGADGGMNMTKVVKSDIETLIELHYLTTDRVRYRRVDIYRGTIVDAALKTLRMAYDLKNQIDANCYNLLTLPLASGGAFGAFTFSGAANRVTYTALPNTRINQKNLPGTNDLVMTDNTATTSFRFRVIRVIRKYADQWAGAFPEGDLVPTGEILIPGADASDIAEEIVPSGNTNNRVADELLENGWSRISYMGQWTLRTDNTLPPGSCLANFNRKPGRVYFKPSQDREMVRGEDVYELAINNEEERWAQKPFGAYISSATRMNGLRIKYRN